VVRSTTADGRKALHDAHQSLRTHLHQLRTDLKAADFEVVKLGWKPPDDAALPRISIGDASVTEGQAGSVNAVFTVSLSAPFPVPVGVSYATAPVTASAADVVTRYDSGNASA
jgi:hypothetical protein